MLTRKVGAAMGVGCTAVVKTPEDTPYTPMALVEVRGLLFLLPSASSDITYIYLTSIHTEFMNYPYSNLFADEFCFMSLDRCAVCKVDLVM